MKSESHPTLRQVESLAKMTSTPLGYFFLDEPPSDAMPIPHFRTVRQDSQSLPSSELLETIQIMQLRQAWMRDYLRDEGVKANSLVRAASLSERTEFVSEKLRKALGFDADWASHYQSWTKALDALRNACEDAGVLVTVSGIVGNNTHRKLSVDEFRGFVLVDEFAPLVFVNGADGKAAQMFTLAHEMAHVAFGSSAAFDLRRLQPADDETELKCNAVAAEFLVPRTLIEDAWSAVERSPVRFQTLARRFKVSEIVVARRAQDVSLISRQQFLDFYQQYIDKQREPRRKSSGGDFYATQNLRLGKRFSSAVARAAREGRLLYGQAYKLTGLYGKSFHQYVELLGLGGKR